MTRMSPAAGQMLTEAYQVFERAVISRWIAFELARANAIADPAQRADRHARLRERFRSSEMKHAAAMHAATQGLSVDRLFPAGPAVSRIRAPEFRDDGILLYVPGGSFVVPRSPQFTGVIARIARAAGSVVAICDYRLAPEHPCPAAVDDAEDAFDSLVAQGHDPDRIVIVAESTGGGIALAAAQRLVARGRRPGGLALLSPWADCDPGSPHLDPATRQCARLYLNGADPRDPEHNPMYGPMRGLPPITIHASRGDSFFADAEALARRAAAAGVEVELRHWPGRLHVLERHDDADARRSIAEIAGFINRRLAPLREAA